eukprot:923025-Amphidinium_carterae.2
MALAAPPPRGRRDRIDFSSHEQPIGPKPVLEIVRSPLQAEVDVEATAEACPTIRIKLSDIAKSFVCGLLLKCLLLPPVCAFSLNGESANATRTQPVEIVKAAV